MTDHIRSHLQALVGERHPLTSPTAIHEAERYLAEQFRNFGLDVSTHGLDAFGGTYHNVIATLPHAEDPHSPPLIIAAHYDTMEASPGADDNASGLAVLLEVARRLCDQRTKIPVQLIAFCLEEEDLFGSLAYVHQLRMKDQQIRGALVLECVGYASSAADSQQVPQGIPIHIPSVGDFLGIVGNVDSAGLVTSFERAANQAAPGLKTVSLVVPGQGEMLPDTRRSDHAAFWHYGFPALMLTDTANYRNPHYHQPSDTIDTLDLGFISRVADAVTASALAIAGNG